MARRAAAGEIYQALPCRARLAGETPENGQVFALGCDRPYILNLKTLQNPKPQTPTLNTKP